MFLNTLNTGRLKMDTKDKYYPTGITPYMKRLYIYATCLWICHKLNICQACDEYIDDYLLMCVAGNGSVISGMRAYQYIRDLWQRKWRNPMREIFTGSSYEGNNYEVCSDQDVMEVYKDFPVVTFSSVHDQKGVAYVILNPAQPAFVLLKSGCEISMRQIKQVRNDKIPHECSTAGRNAEPHGPAFVHNTEERLPHYGHADTVPCLRCQGWPPHALEFFTRPRISGLPSPSLLERVKNIGCHVVPIGHPASLERENEWRISFSEAEKEIIHYFHENMGACIYAMKKVKPFIMNHAKEHTESTIFCSYFIKTACLWINESCDSSTTKPVALCQLVIDWLRQCYDSRIMPHYFIPQQNLIAHLEGEALLVISKSLQQLKYLLCLIFLSTEGIMMNPLQLVFDYRHDINSKISTFSKKKRASFQALENEISVAHCALKQMIGTLKSMDTLQNRMMSEGRTVTRMMDTNHSLHLMIANSGDRIHDQTFPSFIENIMQEMIAHIKEISIKGYEKLCIHQWYRDLGASFQTLAFLTLQKTPDMQEVYFLKAEEHYKRGLVLRSPDGWDDQRLGGYVRLGALYHLFNRWSKLDSIKNDLITAYLEHTKHRDVVSEFHYISVGYEYNQDISWRQDTELYDKVMKPQYNTECFAALPIALFCLYILSKSALRKCDMKTKEFIRRLIRKRYEPSKAVFQNSLQINSLSYPYLALLGILKDDLNL